MNQRDFVVLWTGQTLSVFGSAVSVLALPSVAILLLHATPLQLGILEALAFAAFPVLGLFVGVLADRTPRRRVMIVADVVRAAALASIPLAAAAHALGFTQLAIVALVTGIGAVFFDVCYQSYLPSLVATGDLSRANARLEFTHSAAEVGGNGFAGLLISVVGAATAVGVDALSFLVSVSSLLATRCTQRFGLGATLTGSTLIGGVSPLFLPLALHTAPVAVLFVVTLAQTVMTPIYNINQVSLRQTMCRANCKAG